MAFGSKNDRKKMLSSIMDEANGEAILGQIDNEIQSEDNRSQGLGAKAAGDSLSDTYENISSMKRSLGERKQADAKASAAMQKPNGKPSVARDWLTYLFGQEEADAPEVAAKREELQSIGPSTSRSDLTDKAKKASNLERAIAAIKANKEKPVPERDRTFLDTGVLIDDLDIPYVESDNPDDRPITYSGSGVSIEDRFPDDDGTLGSMDSTFVEGPLTGPDDVPITKRDTEGLMTRPKARPSSITAETKDFEIPEYKVFDKPSDMSDLEILARTIEAEASGEEYTGKIAVGAVIANRASSGSYGSSGGIKGVILKKAQFSPWNSFTGGAKGEQGKDMMALKASDDSYRAANAILTGGYTDPTNGSTHYVNESAAQGQEWISIMKSSKKGTIMIGNHLFGNADNNKVYDGRTGSIQRIVGTKSDGQFGPATRKKALTFLKSKGLDVTEETSNEDLMQLIVAS